MMQEKMNALEEAYRSDPTFVGHPPSSPKRHEKWKRARQQKLGNYINEDALIISEKIDSLVQESNEGSFVSHGRQDILTTAIGKSEHPGCVRGVGRGVGIKQYFGRHSHYCSATLSMEHLELLKQQIREQVTQELTEKLTWQVTQQVNQQVSQQLASFGFSQQNNVVDLESVLHRVSTKGSCIVSDPSIEDSQIDTHSQCELYVDPTHLVAIGQVYNLGSTIHHKKIEDGNVRVVVEEVKDADALVLFPIDEVQTVGQAINHFIEWPRKLVKYISSKVIDGCSIDLIQQRSETQVDSLEQIFMLAGQLKNPLKVHWNPSIFGFPSDVPFYIERTDLLEIYMGTHMISISVIRFWLMYLHHLCIGMVNPNDYGFIDPQSIQDAGNKIEDIQTYLKSRLCEGKREINREMKNIIEFALDEYHRLMCLQPPSKKKPTWIIPRCE